jgi:hypothetical protein
MKSPSQNRNTESSGCLSSSSGCLITALLFPFCITLSMGLSFALGPMGCALPNKCSKFQENAKGILSLVILLGGGVGIPIATGIWVGKVVQNGVMDRSNSTNDNEY